MDPRRELSRRERQILEVVYRRGEASVSEVLSELSDPPGYDSVRTTLRFLEEKGVVRHRRDGQRYMYSAVVRKERAREGALRELVRTFFDGSARAAALALLKLDKRDLDPAELARLMALLDGDVGRGEGVA